MTDLNPGRPAGLVAHNHRPRPAVTHAGRLVLAR